MEGDVGGGLGEKAAIVDAADEVFGGGDDLGGGVVELDLAEEVFLE